MANTSPWKILEGFDSFDIKTVKKEEILNGKGFLLHGLLTPEESKCIIKAAEEEGYDEKASGNRFCLRKVVREDHLEKFVWNRVKPFMIEDHEGYTDSYGDKWKVCGINPNFRSCKYNTGHVFGPHVDFSNYFGKNKSWYTIMLYLNDHNEFEGGEAFR